MPSNLCLGLPKLCRSLTAGFPLITSAYQALELARSATLVVFRNPKLQFPITAKPLNLELRMLGKTAENEDALGSRWTQFLVEAVLLVELLAVFDNQTPAQEILYRAKGETVLNGKFEDALGRTAAAGRLLLTRSTVICWGLA